MNENKVKEVRQILPVNISVLSLNDLGWTDDLPEPFESLEENARAKAYFVYDRTHLPCFAEDSGLEVEALNGRPGVLSARYAGEDKSSEKNILKVLAELDGKSNRKAKFRAVIAYISKDGTIQLFSGEVQGKINYAPAGKSGFGYDPIFIPDGFDQTFAEMDNSIKNNISHRAIAMNSFTDFIRGI